MKPTLLLAGQDYTSPHPALIDVDGVGKLYAIPDFTRKMDVLSTLCYLFHDHNVKCDLAPTFWQDVYRIVCADYDPLLELFRDMERAAPSVETRVARARGKFTTRERFQLFTALAPKLDEIPHPDDDPESRAFYADFVAGAHLTFETDMGVSVWKTTGVNFEPFYTLPFVLNAALHRLRRRDNALWDAWRARRDIVERGAGLFGVLPAAVCEVFAALPEIVKHSVEMLTACGCAYIGNLERRRRPEAR